MNVKHDKYIFITCLFIQTYVQMQGFDQWGFSAVSYIVSSIPTFLEIGVWQITICFLFLGFTATLSKPCFFSAEKCRVFRPDKSYAVTQGKWYFEYEILTAGNMRVGWARPGCTPDKELGSDDQAYVFDGFEVRYN